MKNKSALIIGGMGMVGRQLTKLCSKEYGEVCVLDIDYKTPKDLPQTKFCSDRNDVCVLPNKALYCPVVSV